MDQSLRVKLLHLGKIILKVQLLAPLAVTMNRTQKQIYGLCAIHIDTISLELSIFYCKESHIVFSLKWCISVHENWL